MSARVGDASAESRLGKQGCQTDVSLSSAEREEGTQRLLPQPNILIL